MGGPNLEVFKFGMYIMFPIGWMYYFGTNLDSRFAVPDFWPKANQSHTIPFEREEMDAELERLKQRRLAARARRLELEARGENTDVTYHQDQQASNPRPEILQATKMRPLADDGAANREGGSGKGLLGWFR